MKPFHTMVLCALAFAAAPAVAATDPGYRLTTERTFDHKKSVVIDDVLWTCKDQSCSTGHAGSKPLILCEKIARRIGRLTSFAVGTVPFDDDALAKCNMHARSTRK